MGAAESTEAREQTETEEAVNDSLLQQAVAGGINEVEGEKVGFHILAVLDGSPAAWAGFEPYFDYIISVNGHRLDKSDNYFMEQIQANLNLPVEIGLFSTKFQKTRNVTLTPSLRWGDNNSIIGCSIRFCSFEHAGENVWHVMHVYPESPAALAGFRPNTDYILAASEYHMKIKEHLFELVQMYENQPLRLIVYNWQDDNCREIEITPNSKWGGEGLLGCDIGYGYLHRIPNHKFNSPGAGGDGEDGQPADDGDNVTAVQQSPESSLIRESTSITSLPELKQNLDVSRAEIKVEGEE